MFKESFIKEYLKLANDKVVEVQLHFLQSVVETKPHIEHDLNLLLELSELLNNLSASTSNIVANKAQEVEE